MLTVKNLRKDYGAKTALAGVTFSIEEGVCGLLGPNGAGKTTLFRCLAGLLKPSDGSYERPEQLGYLPQRFGAYKQLTVYELLEYYAALKKIPKPQQREQIEEALETVNLSDVIENRCGTLSGGMIRRLGIAQAILGSPELILLDEPTAGLDPEERMRFKLLMSRLRKKRIPTIISTHIIEDVEAICERIMIINQGRIVIDGSTAEILQAAENKVSAYMIPTEKLNELTEEFYPVRSELVGGEEFTRIVSSKPQPGQAQALSLEDGYFCCIHKLL